MVRKFNAAWQRNNRRRHNHQAQLYKLFVISLIFIGLIQIQILCWDVSNRNDANGASRNTHIGHLSRQRQAVAPFHLPEKANLSTTVQNITHVKVDSHAPAFMNSKNQTGMSACLFIMDDSIRLLEWLAYHYTVLPLSHLIVAIDPHSCRVDRLVKILKAYQNLIKIEFYTRDEEWITGLKDDEGWGRQIYDPSGKKKKWFLQKNSTTYQAQNHKRRQNYFSSICLQRLYELGSRQWTILLDSDEFLIYNYRHSSYEQNATYDAATDIVTKEDIQMARNRILPLRETTLPRLSERVTISDYLDKYISTNFPANYTPPDLSRLSSAERKALRLQGPKDHALETAGAKIDRAPRCIRFPHLQFSSKEDKNSDQPASLLLTSRQVFVGPLDNQFSKAMLDLSQAKSSNWFNPKNLVNVHTPSRRMCGRVSKQAEFSASGTDYLSSLFRIHHYRSGTIETYLERSGDYRGSGLWRFYAERNIHHPVAKIVDILPWQSWFIHKVGKKTATKLLFTPLEQFYLAYHQYDFLSTTNTTNGLNNDRNNISLLYHNAKQVLRQWQQEGRLENPAVEAAGREQ